MLDGLGVVQDLLALRVAALAPAAVCNLLPVEELHVQRLRLLRLILSSRSLRHLSRVVRGVCSPDQITRMGTVLAGEGIHDDVDIAAKASAIGQVDPRLLRDGCSCGLLLKLSLRLHL